MVANQTECYRLEWRSAIKFLVTANGKPSKFTEKCMMCAEKHVLVKKMFTNCLNVGLQLRALDVK